MHFIKSELHVERREDHSSFLNRFVLKVFTNHQLCVFLICRRPGILDAKYEYHKIGVRLFKRIYMSPFGFADTQWEGGLMLGRVPFPLLFVHRGNQTFFHDPNTFNMMNWFEFVSDKYVSVDYYHHFNGTGAKN